MSKIKKLFQIKILKALVLIILFKFLSVFIHLKHWVICERGTDARDNGYWFYKYLKENHPEIKVFYFIDRSSADYKKVKEDAIQYGSAKSYWLALTAKKIVSSHYGLVLPSYIGRHIFLFSGLHKKYYFLQHGVIPNDLPFLYKENSPMQLFICGAKPEYEFVLKKFGHPENVIQYTGLARFDQLHEFEVKNQILVMPTWRMTITSKESFLNSNYFKQWQELLLNKQLIEKLEANKTNLIFYAHYEMQKYMDCFTSSSKNIILAKFEDYDVQTLLKESAVLITDYSSVFFDFAYMKKPIVYFQFDEKEFFSKHYKKGYFDYKENGFGDVCYTVDSTVKSILELFENNFNINQYYTNRTTKFFPLYDKKNCERIYDRIIQR